MSLLAEAVMAAMAAMFAMPGFENLGETYPEDYL